MLDPYGQSDPPDGGQEWVPLAADLGERPPPRILSGRRVRRWALVLEARGYPFRLERLGFGWQLLVPVGLWEAARQELHRYETENRHWPPPPPPPTGLGTDNALSIFFVLALLAAFHQTTLLRIDLLAHHPVDWVALGNAHAGRIMAGQWWRTITALTLHADWPHLLSNIAIGGFFIHRLCRELGSGLSWSLVVAAGSLGNLVNAWLHSPSHRAVGASTAVFGALGLLAALNLIRYRHSLRRRWLLPVAAALALLAMLGTEGERTDVGAHLFGFAAGLLLGVATALVTARRGLPRRLLNGLLATAAAAMVLGGWLAALTAG